MDYFRQACLEIVEELKKNAPETKEQFNKIKAKVLNNYKSKQLQSLKMQTSTLQPLKMKEKNSGKFYH